MHPRGPFSLTAAVRFGEGLPGTRADRASKALRYAWAVDGDWRTVQVVLRQDDRAVHAELPADPPLSSPAGPPATSSRCSASTSTQASGFA